MGFIDGHDDVLKLLEQLVYAVLTRLYKEHADDLKSLQAPELKLTPEFPRYSMKKNPRNVPTGNRQRYE